MSQLLFEKAELSFAAYAILEPGMVGRDLEDRLKGAGFSETQARRFAERYRVVDQYTNTENGLSVTFFERLSGNPPEQIIAIRGTEFGADFINDVVIADVLGIGTSPDGRDLAQYNSLRWAVDTWLGGSWLRPGYSIAGHSLGGYLGGVLAGDPLARAGQAYLYNAPGTAGLVGPLTQTLMQRFGLSNWSAPNVTEIEGSAGLSLIAGIGQDFSGNKVIAEIESQTNPFNNHSVVVLTDALAVYALYSELAPSLDINSAGLLLRSASATNKGTLEGALDALRKTLLGANVTATAEENRESLYANLYALQDSAAYLALRGSAAVRLTAVQDAATLAGNAKRDFGSFLAVKYLLPVAIEGSSGVLGTIHADLYTEWQADQALTPEQRKQGQANFTDDYLADRAAFLTWKNKLALEDADASTTAYSKGGTPDAWFRDNASNFTLNLGNQGPVTDKRRFIFGTDSVDTLSGGTRNDRLYGGGGNDTLYGFDQNDYLEGNAGDDRLEGSDGDDILVGGAGIDELDGGANNDTLYGGRGDDILKGGAGEDTYVINTGDGHDHIQGEDDGRNYIRHNGRLIAGTFVQSTPGGAYQFIGEAGSDFSMQFHSPGVLTLDEDTSITFDNYTSADAFEEANYGIQLVDAALPVDYTRVIQGDRELLKLYAPATLVEGGSLTYEDTYVADGVTYYNAQYLDNGVEAAPEDYIGATLIDKNIVFVSRQVTVGDNSVSTVERYHIASATWEYNQWDDLGNFARTDVAKPAKDYLNGSEGNDRILAGEWDDEVRARGGDDRIELGAGEDHAQGGEGADIIVGEAGRDVLFGQAGDDLLYANAERDPAAALTQGESQPPQDGEQSWLDGGDGDDRLTGDAGSDILLGGAGGDLILGGGGDDHLAGDDEGHEVDRALYHLAYQVLHEADAQANGVTQYRYRYATPNEVARRAGGDDAIYGGAGADWLLGQGGDDTLDGGADADVVFGDEGDDTILGGGGDDFLSGDGLDNAGDPDNPGLPGTLHGQDYLEGGAGDDRIAGNGGDDVLYGDEGNDEINGDDPVTPAQYHGDDYLDGGEGADTLVGAGGNDQIYGGEGDDTMAGDGENIAAEFQGNDHLDGEAGNDYLRGYGGDDTLIGGSGSDELHGEAGDDSIDSGEGNDLAFGDAGNDRLAGGAGNDSLGGGEGEDAIDGGEGDDILVGEAGNDVLGGGAGNDQLSGGEGNDVLAGGAGTDLLDGGLGDDTYVIDAADLLAAPGSVITGIRDAGGANRLILAGMDLGGVTVAQGEGENANDLVLTLGEGSRITIDEGLAGAIGSYGTGEEALMTPVEFLEAAASGSLNLNIGSNNAFLAGGRGDDHLIVNGSGNTIAGGKGNDLIEIGGADNTVDYRIGDGIDTIRSLAATGTAIRFGAGITPADIRLRLEGGDLVVGVGEGADSALRLPGFDRERPLDNPPIGALRFADGSAMTFSELLALGLEISGTDGDDAMQGTGLNDRLLGLAGNDVLNGSAGNDVLNGAEGNDVLNGGIGSDVLIGGEGADTYEFNAGSGTDTLVDAGGGRIELGMGIALSSVGTQRDGANLVLHMPEAADAPQEIPLGDSIVIQGYFDAPQTWEIHDTSGNSATAEELLSGTWANGRDWVRTLMDEFEQSCKLALANEFVGQGYSYVNPGELQRYAVSNAFASFISGEQTQVNTYEWFDGRRATDTQIISLNDWRPSQSAMIDDRHVRIDTQTAMVSGSASFGDMWSWAGASQSEQKWVGMNWTATSLSAVQTDHWTGTSLISSDGITVGTVNSDNTSRHQSGYARGSITSVLAGPPAVVPGAGQLFPNVGRALFQSSDSTYSFQIVEGDDGDSEITGGGLVKAGAGNDTVTTRGFIDGGDGNDRLYNGAVMVGGHGDDLLWGLDNSDAEALEVHRYCFAGIDQGADLVVDEGWIGYSEGFAEYFYTALDPYFLGQGAEHWAARYFHAGEWVVDDGFEWRNFFQTEEEALAAASTLGGTARFVDALPDEYQLHADDAAGLAPLVSAGLIADDVVEFGPGIAPEDLGFAWGHARPEGLTAFHDTLDITYETGSVARIVMPNANDYLGWGVESFRFADGRRLTMAELLALAPPRPEYNFIQGTEWSDTLTGTALSDMILGAGESDQLYGLDGNDELDGGAGDDTLVGGAGNDTYRFGRGGGFDTVVQTDEAQGDVDMLRFDDDVLPEQVLATRENDALLLTIADTGDAITLQDWFVQPDTHVDQVMFSDGTIWTSGMLEQAPVLITGTYDADYMEGTDHNDLISGLTGDDHLRGGAGNDVYWFERGDGADTIYQDTAADGDVDTIRFGGGIAPSEIVVTLDWSGLKLAVSDSGDAITLADWFFQTEQRIDYVEFADGTVWNNAALEALASRTTGSDMDEVLWGTSGDDVMTGFGGWDQVYGGNGNDLLNGGADDDNLDGGTGNDIYLFNRGDGMDWIFDNGLETDIDTLRFGEGIAPGDVVVKREEWSLYLTLRGTQDVAGLDGWFSSPGGRIERVEFADGTVWEAASLEGRLYDNHMVGTAGNDRLTGTAGRDVIEGLDGNDVINGAAGADTLIGGLGNDTYYVDDAGDVVTELADEGTDRVISTVSHVLGDNVENLTLTGTEAIGGTGNALNNTLVGNAASNMLDGLLGDDRLTGGASDDVLLGGEGNDVLNGSAGTDAMTGGTGNDTYYVDDAGDAVTELADEGTDRVISTVSYTLGGSVENLTLSGTAAISGIGNALNNTLVGNAASNTLNGLAGDDRLTGGANDDALLGGEGNDVLNGSGGADAMAGGAGNDTFHVDDAGDTITELADEGADRVISTISYTLGDNIENLTLTGTEAISGTGNALNNVIVGNAASNTLDGHAGDDRLTGGASDDVLIGGEGNDVLNGSAGADAMAGGLGNDTYYLDDAGDTVTELTAEGTDRIIATVSHVLGDNVENLTLSGTDAINGTGNALDNTLVGNAAVNYLGGGAGNDVLNGGVGLDFLEGGEGNDRLADADGGYYNGGAGNDTIAASGAGDFIIGGAGNDSINTGTGADVIAFNRGDGQDTVAASIGADNVLSLGGGIAYADLSFRRSGNHLILDIGVSDRITLSNWYANTANRSVLSLQVIAEAMADFDAGGADPLRDDRMETFDFAGLANAFDAARAADKSITSWALTNALLDFHLGGGDDAALGGDLAWQYGRHGNLANVGLTGAQNVLGNAQFGVQAQTLQPLAGLQEGAVRLG